MTQLLVRFSIGTILIVCLGVTRSLAQFGAGASFGYTQNKHIAKLTSNSNNIFEVRGGYQIGLSVTYPFLHNFYLESGITYLQKNYGLVKTGNDQGFEETFHNNYVQVPLTMNYVLNGHFLKLSFGAGGYAGYWLSGTVTGSVPDIFSAVSNDGSQTETFQLVNFNSTYRFNNIKDQRLEFGGLIVAGIKHELKGFSIFSQLKFNRAFTSQQKQYMIDQLTQYNQTFALVFGLSHTFDHYDNIHKNR